MLTGRLPRPRLDTLRLPAFVPERVSGHPRARAELLDEKGVDSTHSQLVHAQNYSIEGAVSTKVDNRRARDIAAHHAGYHRDPSSRATAVCSLSRSRPRGGQPRPRIDCGNSALAPAWGLLPTCHARDTSDARARARAELLARQSSPRPHADPHEGRAGFAPPRHIPDAGQMVARIMSVRSRK